MPKIKIVTDSTSFMRKEVINKYGIEIVPLSVNFKNETFFDGTIDNAAFFEKIKKHKEIPSTSQPAPGDFVKVFEKIIKGGNEVISIHISSGISGTVESARTAAKMVDETRISVFDSYSTSAGLSMLVIAAAQAIEQGKTRKEIMEMLKKLKSTLMIIFIPKTLEYLQKGGRIGGAQALLGTILQIKPVLYFLEGKVELLYKVRTMKKALEKVVGELPLADAEKLQVALINADSSENIRKLKQLVLERLPDTKIEIYELSNVIATHVGPVAGLAFMQHI
ncbi:MAG: DegV family protein [Firmicutes bacterium]|nr:DegV family protein [Bacillota bacterium]